MENKEKKITLIGIVVEDMRSAAAVNALLHEFADCIIGRMGLPRQERGVSIISVVLDAPVSAASSLSGKLGMLPGIKVKSIQTKV